MLSLLVLTLFVTGLAFAAMHDVLTMTIPNWVSIAFASTFPVAWWITGGTLTELGWAYGVGLAGFMVCILLFSLNVFGGGDAKLLPAVLIWIGPEAWLPYVYGIALSGGILAMTVLIARKRIPANIIPDFLQRSVVVGPGVPYAIAIGFGALWASQHSQVLSQLIVSSGLSH